MFHIYLLGTVTAENFEHELISCFVRFGDVRKLVACKGCAGIPICWRPSTLCEIQPSAVKLAL